MTTLAPITAIFAARSIAEAEALLPGLRAVLGWPDSEQETGLGPESGPVAAGLRVVLVDHSTGGGPARVVCAALGAAIARGRVDILSVDLRARGSALNTALAGINEGVVIYPGPTPLWTAKTRATLRRDIPDMALTGGAAALVRRDGVTGLTARRLPLSMLAHAARPGGRPAHFAPDPEGLEAAGLVLRHARLTNRTQGAEAAAQAGGLRLFGDGPLPDALLPAETAHLAALERARRRGDRPLRIALKCPAPDAARAHQWGDFHLAESLARALRDHGRDLGAKVRVDLVCDWDGPASDGDDVVILLRGVRRYRTRPHQLNLMWLISHPDRVGPVELDRYDHIFVASTAQTALLSATAPGRVSVLLQCADPTRFGPDATARQAPIWQAPAHPLLFVGNSRRADRPVLDAALAAGHDVAVYGAEWEGRLPPGVLRGDHIPNDRLAAYYAAAGIVLNDHWPDMARAGFVSNRLFDIAMAGGFAISDTVAGPDVFDGNLVMAKGAAALDTAIRHWQARPAERRTQAQVMQDIALRHHTVDHRARDILTEIRRQLG